MTGRTVAEWIGKTPDTPVPPRVRLRVWDRQQGRCHKCKRKIAAGESWTCEHLVALVNGGENRERNLDVTCSWCLPGKNAADVAIKSKTYAVRSKHVGAAKKRSRMPGSKDSHIKMKIGVGPVDRRTGQPLSRTHRKG